MKNILGSRFKLFILFYIFGAALTFAIGWMTQFHALSNDYWNILYYGRNMTLSQPESLYNGFYPFGYAFLIGQMPFTYVLPLSYVLNALLSGLFIASVSTLVAYTDSVPATALAFFMAVAEPFIFHTANTLSPDIGAAAFTAFAVFILCRGWFDKEKSDLPDLSFVLVGLSLGLSFLWRTHAIVSIIAIIAGYTLLNGIRPLRPLLLLSGTLALTAGLQVIVNLISGHGPLETGQAFNLYKFFYGVDWTYPPTPADIEGFSLFKTITEDPKNAFNLYKPFFLYFISHVWAAAFTFLLSPKGRFARFSLFSFLFVVLYAIPISLSDSPRSPVILMSVYLPSIAVLLAALVDMAKKHFASKRWVGQMVIVIFIAIGFQTFYGWVTYDVGVIRAAMAERKVLSVIEQTLLSNGMISPSEVFADRYDFYTPNTMPYRARQIGNWSAGWVWGFDKEFPALPNHSWEAFSQASREQGVRFLVLSQNSHYRGDIFPPIYNEEVDLNALGLQFIAQRGKMRIYVFK
jgi:4-amino-4-deoxy-L-arabinose transferase-like glycosyltransferase